MLVSNKHYHKEMQGKALGKHNINTFFVLATSRNEPYSNFTLIGDIKPVTK